VRQEREQVLRREREQARLEAENDAIKARYGFPASCHSSVADHCSRMEELEKAVNSADEQV
jgi:hypothetical protein